MKYVEIGEPKKRNSRLTVKTEPFEDGLERERPSTLHKRVPRKLNRIRAKWVIVAGPPAKLYAEAG